MRHWPADVSRIGDFLSGGRQHRNIFEAAYARRSGERPRRRSSRDGKIACYYLPQIDSISQYSKRYELLYRKFMLRLLACFICPHESA